MCSKGWQTVQHLDLEIFRKPSTFNAFLSFFFVILQVMRPTMTFSETFHTWPQTIQRSSNVVAQMLKPKSADASASTPAVCTIPHFTLQAHVFSHTCRKASALRHAETSSSWLPATCSVTAQLVLTSEGTNAPNSEFFVGLRHCRPVVSKYKHRNSFMSPAWGVFYVSHSQRAAPSVCLQFLIKSRCFFSPFLFTLKRAVFCLFLFLSTHFFQ